MPRYYFNIHNGHPFEDLVGEDLPDEAAAWKNAPAQPRHRRCARARRCLEAGGSEAR
ncbi:DUF6894 family protein [Bradyrhizobium manausense]|uniref:DUF6894 family protein n=1 Tax=Bradyrhizobium manausense TaxID=989370 RepID=UPI003D310778